MKTIYTEYISKLLSVAQWQVEQCADLLEDGATIPFISRYRKERTGGMDETQISHVKFHMARFEELDKRKQTVIAAIQAAGSLTAELEAQITSCIEPKDLEDIYLPYRPKRRTRAGVAREKGLEPLAKMIYNVDCPDPLKAAERLCNSLNEPMSAQEALAGACDIVSEWFSEQKNTRDFIRSAMASRGTLISRLSKKSSEIEDADKYRNYFDYSEPLSKIPSHRLLAVLRAESEGVVSLRIDLDSEKICNKIEYDHCKAHRFPSKSLAPVLRAAIDDAYKRLLYPSIFTETLKVAKEKADIEAVRLFGINLRQLLLAPALGEKRIMAIDPGFRTGCKVVCLDASGGLLAHDVIYPHPPANERIVSMKKILSLVSQCGVQAIAVGNGTAGRETEAFLSKVGLPKEVEVHLVSEDGASVYSASDIAREEFPQYDVTVRGAVSIGRRLMDPLAELVKIDPKSIGVGQYQHDVDQKLLRESLDETVESCVNSVGVNLNTASRHLLTYVSGIGPQLAESIVRYRQDNGPFASRQDLLKVKRLGSKAYEQCAGFLRIPSGENPLDRSAVHPESYPIVYKMASDLGVEVSQLIENKTLLDKIDPSRYIGHGVGLPTVSDILKELSKPGRDPRGDVEMVAFDVAVSTIDDLHEGMELQGVVTNVTAFGAFVDIGIKQQGLVHVSKMHGRHPESFRVREPMKVRVVSVDIDRKRISLEIVK